jgi:hypothetical protein
VLEAEKGKVRFLLVAIDEAQHLSARALAELQAWSRSGANADALRIVLGAQPVFRSLLCSKGLESLREGLSVCDLSPLALDEVPAYVNHRLRVCGFSGKSLFTPEAFALLARHSGGIPCVINMVGFRSLSIGFRERAKQIDASIVEKAIGEREAVLSSTTAVAASDLSVMPQESKSTEEPRRPEMARVEHASPVPARLVSWMTPRGITWSGTAGELLAELEREGGSQETTWEVTDPEHLWLTLLVESESLARRGIEVGSQERPGRPRFIVIRKTSGWSGAPAEISDRRGNATENRPYIEDRLASGPIVQPSPANEASPTAAVRDGTVVAKRSSDDPSSDRLVRELAERGASGSPEGAALFQAAMELLSEFDKSDETQRTESDPERLWREIQAEAQSPEPGISDNIDQSSPESSPGTDAANDRVRKIAPKSERSEGRKWFRRRGR